MLLPSIWITLILWHWLMKYEILSKIHWVIVCKIRHVWNCSNVNQTCWQKNANLCLVVRLIIEAMKSKIILLFIMRNCILRTFKNAIFELSKTAFVLCDHTAILHFYHYDIISDEHLCVCDCGILFFFLRFLVDQKIAYETKDL